MITSWEERLDYLTDLIFGEDPLLTEEKARQLAAKKGNQIFKPTPYD